ncbi:MAG: bifunctional 3-demethylubiquinol 3-O-methyltransferase/2-polyprenyl-6-hydroxyphenol methylase [Micavibrio aeruginosavorus]|uniref:Bifunctional 3-demethylubiquinol 3-O-methyltransferase/2-polyprenyl-6-hydroxyphenol methylase n=1 Tax=Micavibrio aeruginosavorus TaxID=349221 RepID=A0A2W5PGV6_9BACT|nr:MAG: bifunctional 3-demethylubiquinol 3-O-methyltransferase/2-polyprenyl-6-hydroxyphenol methylase [Micavibrio aeruginosavorus]
MHTVDAKEIENFAKDSAHWWDENGPFRPLHRLNPVRLHYIKEQVCARYGRNFMGLKPFKGLSVLDTGCGGGLVCEPMARLGADVTGIDADANAIAVAAAHAKQSGLQIDYRATSTDGLIASKKKFDVVLALEIVEHVADVDQFVTHCASLCKPNGLIVFSTLNRTPKSFALGKIAAEYVLGWVPKGTHDWKKFLKPSELSRAVRSAGADIQNIEGMVFDPLILEFKRSTSDIDVNYFLSAVKV